jgi:hypothetical protein
MLIDRVGGSQPSMSEMAIYRQPYRMSRNRAAESSQGTPLDGVCDSQTALCWRNVAMESQSLLRR